MRARRLRHCQTQPWNLWIPQIEEAINGDGYTFFAFGAGHLLGERGVLDLLEKDGYKPYRVTAEVVKKQEGNKAQIDPK